MAAFKPAGALDPLRPALILPEVKNDKEWIGGFDSGWADTEKKLFYTFRWRANCSRKEKGKGAILLFRALSSIKSMIGHPQGASGAAGVVAAILGMNHGFLPPTINYQEPDPECDLDYIPNRGFAKSVDIALCNCIGFGSKNSALGVSNGAAR